MLKPIPLIVLSCAALAAVAADDPWKEPYKQWGEKQIRRVMTDSPWSRQVTVPATWQSAPARDTAPVPPATGASTEAGVYAPPTPSSAASDTPQATFIVRWTSAATIRQAMIRNAVLRGSMTEADGEKYLEHRATEYEVIVTGRDMEAFLRANEFDLTQKSHLRLKSSKQKLAPTRVTFERADDGKRIRNVVFRFAKTTAAGEPAIPVAEKTVEFSCQGGPVSLTVSFDLRRMVSREGLDL